MTDMPELPTLEMLAYLLPGLLLALWFAFERGKSLLMFFQQEEYDGPRFIVWLHENRAYDKRASLWLALALLVGTVSQTLLTGGVGDALKLAGPAVWPLMAIALIHGALQSRAVRAGSKKPLVMTARAKRIFTSFLALMTGLLVLIAVAASLAPMGTQVSVDISAFDFYLLGYDWRAALAALLLIGFAQVAPFVLVLANKLLEPAEERVKAKFRAEAGAKFTELQPKVIAITGSFGKTSTKHILQHILANAAPTLATPGSVNTDMGITRVIREQLTPDHQYFIVEMGAYGPGSIARLCRLTPPDVALITAVGAAHYERFKTLETVARAKFEIAEATFARGGRTVVNMDGIPRNLLDERLAAVTGDYTLVGTAAEANGVQVTGYKATRDGLQVDIDDGGETHTLKVPLYGRHQAGNVALAAACARAIGLPWAAIKGALASMPQIRHRLEVTRASGQPTIINDAYNSNPVGFAAALETLDVLVEAGGRRILITPGMVELGEKHAEEHARLGELAAKHADIVAVVTPERIPSFVKALEGANDGSVTVMTFATQDAAEKWARKNWRAGDAVLFENNLPDLYEAKVSF
jgi:UDP-N-acetylmuramoyl-tripeptide--D-alanyl-D-alanine ligase